MRTLILAALTFSSIVSAAEVSYQFRSVEDPAFPPDNTICAQAPFRVNVKLGASLWTQHTRLVDGRVMNNQVFRIGKATACVQLTNFLFPSGLQQNFYAVFDLPSGRYTGKGTCTLSSNNVPQAGLVLAGCTLNVVSGPNGVLGGVITSASTFNPARLAGFSTGSVWTLQAYTSAPVPWWPWTGGGEGFQGFQLHDDQRSDDDIERVRSNGDGT